jgi:hypothetical protein
VTVDKNDLIFDLLFILYIRPLAEDQSCGLARITHLRRRYTLLSVSAES